MDEPRALILVHVESAVGHPAYQVVASVRLKVHQLSHGEQFTKYSVTPPLLLHQWGLTLALALFRMNLRTAVPAPAFTSFFHNPQTALFVLPQTATSHIKIIRVFISLRPLCSL